MTNSTNETEPIKAEELMNMRDKHMNEIQAEVDQKLPDVNTPGYDEHYKGNAQPLTSAPKLFLFSGSTALELKGNLDELFWQVETTDNGSLGDLKTPEINKDHSYRHCILAGDRQHLIELLKSAGNDFQPLENSDKKLAFLVTCQGMQYPRMGRTLYEKSQKFRDEFNACADIIAEEFPEMKGFKHLLFEEEDISWTKEPKMFLPYTLTLEYALFKLVHEGWGLEPTHIMGLSFGDYMSALMCGILNLRDTVKLIMNRCILMTKNIKEEAFLVMEINEKEFNNLFEQIKAEPGMEDLDVDLACKNSPKQTCIVGKKEYLSRFLELCKSGGKKAHLNPHALPYHSKLAAPVLNVFEETTSSVTYGKPLPSIKFISSLDGQLKETLHSKYYLDHLVGPMNALDAIDTLLGKEGVTQFFEIGPNPIYPLFIKDTLTDADSPHYDQNNNTNYNIMRTLCAKDDDRVGLLNAAGRLYLAGFNMKWESLKELEH